MIEIHKPCIKALDGTEYPVPCRHCPTPNGRGTSNGGSAA